MSIRSRSDDAVSSRPPNLPSAHTAHFTTRPLANGPGESPHHVLLQGTRQRRYAGVGQIGVGCACLRRADRTAQKLIADTEAFLAMEAARGVKLPLEPIRASQLLAK